MRGLGAPDKQNSRTRGLAGGCNTCADVAETEFLPGFCRMYSPTAPSNVIYFNPKAFVALRIAQSVGFFVESREKTRKQGVGQGYYALLR